MIERHRLLVQGIVQGVGFRPFVYDQALRLDLAGFVLNASAGVIIEIEGDSAALAAFQQALRTESPPLARIDQVTVEQIEPCGALGFEITQSQSSASGSTLIAPDVSVCQACLSELHDPVNRRLHYPFINCTNCGPRFTIIAEVPYDRQKTTMRDFPLCAACRVEYENPLDRRFHAQPNACAACGPQISLLDAVGQPVATPDSLATAAEQLGDGAILAIKGLGGYHLACAAQNSAAVQRLRQRKHRAARPLAVMALDLATARRICTIADPEAALISTHRRPIVLLRQLSPSPLAAEVTPGVNTLGVMLPYTPLHDLLLRAFAAINPLPVLVLTSANLSSEPIAYRAADHQRLATLAEGRLTHNRPIFTRCDDTVTRVVAGGEQLLRRSRGYVPEPITLAFDCPTALLACGGQLKNTFCLASSQQALISQHIGDLENFAALSFFRQSITHFQQLFKLTPEIVAYDLHPGYLATHYALESDIPLKIGVQHHHAHIASVMAEHGLAGPVIGLAADGTGYGTDQAIWGCEILLAELGSFERLAHLSYMPLPGGEQAIRQPWRMAAVYLQHVYGDDLLALDIPFVRQLNQQRWHALAQMIERKINCPATSSLGRLFDAVAALLGRRGADGSPVAYEGQAAIELEALAEQAGSSAFDAPYPYAITGGRPAQLDVRPLIRAIVADLQRGAAGALIAYRFHCSVAAMLAAGVEQACHATGISTVALSGGSFQNRLLLEQLIARLEHAKLKVYVNRRVPPNDGGLSLGQAAVAAACARTGNPQPRQPAPATSPDD